MDKETVYTFTRRFVLQCSSVSCDFYLPGQAKKWQKQNLQRTHKTYPTKTVELEFPTKMVELEYPTKTVELDGHGWAKQCIYIYI